MSWCGLHFQRPSCRDLLQVIHWRMQIQISNIFGFHPCNALLHQTVVVTPTIFPGTFPPWNSAHPVPKEVTPKTLHHGTPVKTAKWPKHQNTGTYKTQWNTSHTHLERGTLFIIIQMGLHHRTAWNAAFTTWKKAAQNFFPDHHVQRNAGYKAPCAKDPSITPAVAPAGAAPSSSSTSSSTKHQTSSSTKHSDVQDPSKTVLGTRPERGSERGANEVRTRSEGDPQSFTNFTAYPAEETRESSLTSTYPACERVLDLNYFATNSGILPESVLNIYKFLFILP